MLLEYHSKFGFSQDQIELLFENGGLLQKNNIEHMCYNYIAKIKLYSLIYLSLIMYPNLNSLENRKGFIEIYELIGIVKTLSYFSRNKIPSNEEIRDAIRDLTSPITQIIERNNNKVRLYGKSFNSVIESFNTYGEDFNKYITDILNKFEINKNSYEMINTNINSIDKLESEKYELNQFIKSLQNEIDILTYYLKDLKNELQKNEQLCK